MNRWIGIVAFFTLVPLLVLFFYKYPDKEMKSRNIDEAYVFNSLLEVYDLLKRYNYEKDRDWLTISEKIQTNDSIDKFRNPLTNRMIYIRKFPTMNDGLNINTFDPYIVTNVSGSNIETEYYGIDFNLKPMELDDLDYSLFFTYNN